MHVFGGKWTNIWKRDLLGIIKETSHTRFRKSELKVPEVWENVVKKYLSVCATCHCASICGCSWKLNIAFGKHMLETDGAISRLPSSGMDIASLSLGLWIVLEVQKAVSPFRWCNPVVCEGEDSLMEHHLPVQHNCSGLWEHTLLYYNSLQHLLSEGESSNSFPAAEWIAHVISGGNKEPGDCFDSCYCPSSAALSHLLCHCHVTC